MNASPWGGGYVPGAGRGRVVMCLLTGLLAVAFSGSVLAYGRYAIKLSQYGGDYGYLAVDFLRCANLAQAYQPILSGRVQLCSADPVVVGTTLYIAGVSSPTGGPPPVVVQSIADQGYTDVVTTGAYVTAVVQPSVLSGGALVVDLASGAGNFGTVLISTLITIAFVLASFLGFIFGRLGHKK